MRLPLHSPPPAAGALGVRRRDLPLVALLWVCSNGPLARRLGPAGPLMTVFTWPVQLLAASALRPSLVHRGRACAQLAIPGRGGRDAVAVLAACAVFVAWAVAWLLPAAALGGDSGLVATAAALVVLMATESLWDPGRGWWRRRGMPGERLAAYARRTGAATLGGVAAFPRGRGHGGALLHAVTSGVLDAQALPCVLEARTAGLVAFYQRAGFVLVDDRRRMVRGPHPRATPVARMYLNEIPLCPSRLRGDCDDGPT